MIYDKEVLNWYNKASILLYWPNGGLIMVVTIWLLAALPVLPAHRTRAGDRLLPRVQRFIA